MKFKLDHLLAAFGNMRAMERTHVDNHTEEIINSVDQDAFAVSNENVLYINTRELGGYYYLIAIVIGAFKIKTTKGAQLIIDGKNFDLELKSDMEEFESDHSNVSNRYITRIDFIIEEDDVSKIKPSLIKTLTLTTKKQKEVFKIIEK